jgi:hypothetical protein
MLPGMTPIIKPLFRVSASKALQMLGLTASLVLDAGDIASYDGTSQTWVDVSGNGNNFYRGATSGAEASDPTFTGVAGALTAAESFSFDGGDWFVPTGSPTFDDALHHAGAKWTTIALFYNANTGTVRSFFGNQNSGILQGIMVGISAGQLNDFIVQNGTAAQTTVQGGGVTFNLNQWNFAVWSVDEAGGANASFARLNRSTQLLNLAFTSPGVGNASASPAIGSRGGTTGALNKLANGDKLAVFILFNSTNLTRAQIKAFHTLMQGRFIYI